jgi:CPA1 family monovalent cation:H+ antiporter
LPGEATVVTVELFTRLLAAAVLVALVSHRFGIPYSVALVVFGVAVATFAPGQTVEVTPELVLLVLLPGLVFEASFQTDIDSLRRTFGGVALLAIPGVLITAVVVAIALHLTTGLPLDLAFVVGSIVSATDPIAVIATFKRLGTSRRLSTLVEGESLLNDGTAIVVFAIAVRATSQPVDAGSAALSFVLTLGGSAVIGAVAGLVASRVVARVDDHLIETLISVLLAYGTYVVADLLHESGVIATVVAGMTLGTYGRRIGMSARTQEAIDTVWEFLSFMLTAIVFLLVGLAITADDLVAAAAPILVGIVAVLAGRAIVIYGLLGGASRLPRRLGARVPLGWLHVLFWAGLRGGVAVALALSLPIDMPQRTLLRAIAFGIVLFTLIVQGGTIQWVANRALGPRSVEGDAQGQGDKDGLGPEALAKRPAAIAVSGRQKWATKASKEK